VVRASRPLSPTDPTTVALTLDPIASRVERGDRLRITVAFADVDNTETPPGNDRARVAIHSAPRHPTTLELPTSARSCRRVAHAP
jgi:predicted acyl esterase